MGLVSCCSAEKWFLAVNYVFAMYGSSLLITAIRLTLDPSTYAWLRFLFPLQYRVTTGCLYAVGTAVVALVFTSCAAVCPVRRWLLFAYTSGMIFVVVAEVVYSLWMYITLREWWTTSYQAELLRKGIALQDDVNALLLLLEKHHRVMEEVKNAVHEVEEDAPKNAYVICSLLCFSVVMQLAAIALSWLLQRRINSASRQAEWGEARLRYSAVAAEMETKNYHR